MDTVYTRRPEEVTSQNWGELQKQGFQYHTNLGWPLVVDMPGPRNARDIVDRSNQDALDSMKRTFGAENVKLGYAWNRAIGRPDPNFCPMDRVGVYVKRDREDTTMTSTVIDPQRVQEIFRDCLFQNRADTDNAVLIQGIERNVAFNPDDLKDHAEEIGAMLGELPGAFGANEFAGGETFLHLGLDRCGNRWTDSQFVMEELLLLGLAIGRAEIKQPRDEWDSLPGSMPDIVIK